MSKVSLVDNGFLLTESPHSPKHVAGLQIMRLPPRKGSAWLRKLVADLKKEISRDYGVLFDDEVALRGLFLIDPEGTVMHATVNNLPVGRSAKEALRTLKAFQFVASNDGQVCPADWDEGDDTMGASSEGMQQYLAAKHG